MGMCSLRGACCQIELKEIIGSGSSPFTLFKALRDMFVEK